MAFCGRSNVGKSSLINALANRKQLAKTSSTPGKTKLINCFIVNNKFYLIDLPGYGYAKASRTQVRQNHSLVNQYLVLSLNLLVFCLLLDIRRQPSDLDINLILFLKKQNLLKITLFVFTKIDKLKQYQVQQQIKANLAFLAHYVANPQVILTSSKNHRNIDLLKVKI